jgi:hypothetical protein
LYLPDERTPPVTRKIETIVHLQDDIDGNVAEHSVTFMWEGTSYEIDLSAAHYKAISKALAPYIEHGRRLSKSGRIVKRTNLPADPKAIRAWAESAGVQVNSMGRIPAEIVDQFNAAH